MLRWALAFFVVAVVAALLGFTGIAVASAGIAKNSVLHLPRAVPDFAGRASASAHLILAKQKG